MKSLLIIRHAKAAGNNAAVSDIDRPLNDRGRHDAPEMARRLIRKGIAIDLFVSSTAKRARQTAELFIREFGRKEKEIRFVPELYHASTQTFREVVSQLDDQYSSIAIFSHNPGITAFVNMLSSVQLDNMPTCSVFAVTSPAGHWTEFLTAGTEFRFFDYPKSGAD